MANASMAPDAVLSLAPPCNPGRDGNTLYFFKNRRYFCWDVARECMLAGFPRDVAADWPGLLDVFPGSKLRGALHVPAWGAKAYFMFDSQPDAAVWDIALARLDQNTVPWQELLPSVLTRDDFTAVSAKLADGRPVVYGFKEFEYTCWTVEASPPAREQPGFPRRIDSDWKDGLVIAPQAGVYVDWPSRSSAHANRKLYFFMGNLYLRWDVTSNTRNYRLDIGAGWKGWPTIG